MAHWTDAYIGLPYILGEQDCAAVVARVQREVFGRAMAMVHQRNQDIFGCLTDKEQASLSALFDRLISHARPR